MLAHYWEGEYSFRFIPTKTSMEMVNMSQLIPAAAGNVAGTGFSALDLFGVMVAKRASEIALRPMVGTGTWKSSLAKGFGALIAYGASNTQTGMVRHGGHILAAGLAFDAFEDATIALLGPDPLFTITHIGQPQQATQAADQWATISM